MDPYSRIAQAIEYVNEHFQEQPSLEAVAAHVHLSPFHLQRLFTEWAGISPKKFLQYLTLDFAKSQLKAARPLAEVAFQAGLSGTSRLHDLFVKIEGVSPGTYKKGGLDTVLHYGQFDSPFGPLLMASIDSKVCFIRFGELPVLLEELQQEWPAASLVEDQRALQAIYSQLFGTTTPAHPISVQLKGTPFQLKVWEALLQIPEGSCVGYQQIAEAIGKPKATRAVGTAIGRNPIAFLIPCHRVLRQRGKLGGYRWGLTRKQAMLVWEQGRKLTE